MDILISQNQLQTTTGLSISLVRSLQCTKGDLLTPLWGRGVALAEKCSVAYFFRQSPPRRSFPEAGLCRSCERGFSSFVRRKRSERRWAVDQAVGRAKQGRSTWPWSERWPVDASAAEKDRLRVRVCRPRAGQHRVPESRPKGGTALINMFEPALASLSLRRTALACTGPLKLDAPFPLCRQVGKGRDVPKNQLLVLLSRSGFSRRASATLARSEEVFFVAPGLSTDASVGRRPACPRLRLMIAVHELAGAGDGAPAS